MKETRQAFKYQLLARELEEKILSGTYKIGEKLPSVREMRKRLNLSVSTVFKALIELETKGLIEARPKSGYYVKPERSKSDQRLVPKIAIPQQLDVLAANKISSIPHKIQLPSFANQVLKAVNNPDFLHLGSSVVSSDFLPHKQFLRILKDLTSREMESIVSYGLPQGDPDLRRQIALRSIGVLEGIGAEDIIVTNGCTEAMSLSLKALVQPGDTIAIEAPTFYGILPLLEEMELLVVEIPTDPVSGVDVDRLKNTIENHDIKTCLFTPNFHNPLGALIPAENKKRLVELLNGHDIPIIEDSVNSELFYGKQRPQPLKAFDKKNLVVTCSSFSKALTSGLRIGWVIPGERFKEKILKLKTSFSVSTSSLDQYLLARFLESGVYERHLRSLRERIKKQVTIFADAIKKYFPAETKVFLPQGGLLLWVRLPGNVDSLEIYKKALDQRISILPGIIFSSSGQFRDFIRIGCGFPFSKKMGEGFKTLGTIIKDHMNQTIKI
ncbi:PLP-dependent aminotransferase family protein [bacterium]|nr:PLP-dependent aminotransferase family protein [bacterium]